MRGRTTPVIVVFFLCVLLLFLAFNIDDAFAGQSNQPGFVKGVGTEIKSLPYTISSPGFYYITEDLSCGAGGHGITIDADNVTLDLMGFSLVGPGGTGVFCGIFMDGRTNVEIRNGTVRNFQASGIVDTDSTGLGHRILNVRAIDNGGNGIALVSKSGLVKSCAAAGNGGTGIFANLGSTVTGNTCHKNTTYGIFAYAGSTVTANTCYDNGSGGPSYGIHADTGSTVAGNTCCGNADNGIHAGKGSTITGNTCNDNQGSFGIYVDTGSTVIGNTCRGNTGTGIYLVGHSLVDRNTAYDNGINMNHYFPCTFGTNHAP